MHKGKFVFLIICLLVLSSCQSTVQEQVTSMESIDTREAPASEIEPAQPIELESQDQAKYDLEEGALEEPTSLSKVSEIWDYFPFESNIVKKYKSDLGQESTSITQFMNADRIQFLSKTNNKSVVSVYERDVDEIRVVFRKENVSYRENYLEQTGFVGTYLRGPVEVGTSWVNIDNQEATITAVDVDIEGIPSIEVTTESTISYFGYLTGLVKSIQNVNSTPTTETLSEFHRNQTSELELIIYTYYNDKWQLRPVKYWIRTNDRLEDVLLKEFINSEIVNDKTRINSMTKKLSDERVYVDFNKEIYSEINSYEEERLKLQSIVRSISYIYGTNEIYLWVEGQAYQGPFIQMTKNELLKVSD